MSAPSQLSNTQRVLLAGTGALALWACVAAIQVVVPAARADLATIQTRWHIDQWASGKAPAPGIVAWGNARNAVVAALQTSPHNPQLHEHLAYLYASRAQQASAVAPELASSLMAQALASYQQAVALRPMSGPLWAHVALASHSLEPVNPETLWPAFDKAMAYGQREPSVQYTLADIGFARWAQLTEPRRTALQAMLALAAPHAQPKLQALAERHGKTELLPTAPAQPE